MTQEPELPALPKPRVLCRFMPEDYRYGDVYGFTADQMRAYATAAVLAERERQQSPHMRRLTGLWRFGSEVLPVANISFEASLFQLDGFINEKTQAHPLTPPAVKEG